MSGQTILVVEDNAISRKMMSYALRSKGFSVLEAADGATAERHMRDRPHLVLLDLVLGDTDGFRLAERLRQMTEENPIPIIACSGFTSKFEEAQISATCFDDVIIKPVEPSRLIQIVRAHLPVETSVADLGAGRTVLVADDDPIQLKLVMHRLSRAGFKAVGVANGALALEEAKRLRPAAILSDVMMPVVDGFSLCQAIRSEPSLAATPVVLTTNTYVEADDRELAKNVGADDLVIRTPELREAINALHQSLERDDDGVRSSREVMTPKIERERTRRVVKQLEKQVSLNSALMQRCAALSAEISVLSGISQALSQGNDVDTALDGTLAACLDAGGISRGALYVFGAAGTSTRAFGMDGATLECFVKDASHVEKLVAEQRTQVLAAPDEKDAQGVLVPLVHQREPIGALLLVMSKGAAQDRDRVDFAESVANQIALALVLTRTFRALVRSEHAAREQAMLLRSILDAIGDGVIATDSRAKVTHLNQAASLMTGAAVREGEPIPSAQMPLYRSDFLTAVTHDDLPLSRALRGEDVAHEEMVFKPERLPEGVWLSVTARPVRDGGEVRGAVVVFRDVSSEKQAQTQLMISDRLASLGVLAAGVAHEIGNPLAAIIANVECARDEVEAISANGAWSSIREELADAHEAAKRLQFITGDLKTFSRIDDVLEPIEVAAAMEASLRLASNEVRHRAKLEKDYGSELPRVRANEARLTQVFLNLIINALQAMPAAGRTSNVLRVVTRFDGRRVLAEVQDTGPGIPPETLKQLFTPFFTTKARGVGTGLGLSICRRIVEALAGEIEIDTELGRGTTFRVSLPPLKA